MSHKHHNCDCIHDDVKYCKTCKVVHCLDCNQEWGAKYTWSYQQGYPWYYTNTIGGGNLQGGSYGGSTGSLPLGGAGGTTVNGPTSGVGGLPLQDGNYYTAGSGVNSSEVQQQNYATMTAANAPCKHKD